MKGLYETILKHPLVLRIKVKGQVQHRSKFRSNRRNGCRQLKFSDFAGLYLKKLQAGFRDFRLQERAKE